MKTAAERLEQNLDNVSGNNNPYKDPEGHERMADKTVFEPSEGFYENFVDGNPAYLVAMFNQFKPARETAKQIVSQNFNTKDYEARQVLLRNYAEKGVIPSPDTLREKVNKIL